MDLGKETMGLVWGMFYLKGLWYIYVEMVSGLLVD